jgi:type VI secretion system protein ImpA
MGRWLEQPDHNMASLLAPLSAEKPCGEWLRYQGTYEQVREARREDDANLPQGVWQSELKRPEWGTVEALCGDALVHRSKDLQFAAWLLEAWIQLDGFAGAARGIELMQGLCAAFWEEMYPAIADGLEARLAPIQWVNEKMERRIRLIALTQPTIENVLAYSLADWDVALRNPSGGGSKPTVTMASFQQSVGLTSHEWLLGVHRDALETVAGVRAFDALIDEKAGKLAPGLLQFRNEALAAAQLIGTMVDATRSNVPQLYIEPEPQSEGGLSPVPFTSSGSQTALVANEISQSGRPIRSRAEAYSLLEEIAAFLHQTDPHSPTPYLLFRAISWGDMHFDELLPELVRNNGELSDIIKLLRIEVRKEQT